MYGFELRRVNLPLLRGDSQSFEQWRSVLADIASFVRSDDPAAPLHQFQIFPKAKRNAARGLVRDGVLEVQQWLERHSFVNRDSVWLMPQATSVDELQRKSLWLPESAAVEQLHYSPRLHIEQFGNVPGC